MLHEIDLSRADLNLLVLFETVLHEGHVGRAADRLSLSPSAVSHGLGRLRRLLNDPLFLRTPRGVVPTARAKELAEPIADVLARARRVIASAEPFDPATSMRRFMIGAPDAISAVFLPSLLADLHSFGPRIDIGVKQVLPEGGRPTERAWDLVLAEIEAREVDLAILPVDDMPARFVGRTLSEEDFVIAMQAKHPFKRDPSTRRYCEMRHLVVSASGDPQGFVDIALASQGLSRRVALTVPNFMQALAILAETDFISAIPRSLATAQAGRFGLTTTEAPIPLPRFRLRAVAPKVALMDAGLAWLFDRLQNTFEASDPVRVARRS